MKNVFADIKDTRIKDLAQKQHSPKAMVETCLMCVIHIVESQAVVSSFSLSTATKPAQSLAISPSKI